MRWRIAVLVSAAIAISYSDRQTLPVATNAITREIPVTMAKDVSSAVEEAHQRQLDLPTASAALVALKQAVARGFGEKDFTSVVQAITADQRKPTKSG